MTLEDLFSTAAIRDADAWGFTGREAAFVDAVAALRRPGSSIAVFGQKGIGKTSFGAQLVYVLRGHLPSSFRDYALLRNSLSDRAYTVVWLQCTREMNDVTGVLIGLLSEKFNENVTLPSLVADSWSLFDKTRLEGIERTTGVNLFSMFKIESKTKMAAELRYVPPTYSSESARIEHAFLSLASEIRSAVSQDLVIVLDEFDILPNKAGFGQLIKTTNVARFIIIGSAENPTQLIDDHTSVSRELIELPLGTLTRSEMDVLFDKGEELARGMQLSFGTDYRAEVERISGGHPELVKDLGYETISWVRRSKSESKSITLTETDLETIMADAYGMRRWAARMDAIKRAIGGQINRQRVLFTLLDFPPAWVSRAELKEALPRNAQDRLISNIGHLSNGGVLEESLGGDRVRQRIPKDRLILWNCRQQGVPLVGDHRIR
jgi:hypothetical protein